MPNTAECVVMKKLPYADGVALQKARVAAMAENQALPGLVVLAEHLPVITCGRSGDGSNLLVSPEALARAGIDYYPSSRGGDVTYHGPGQWTVYPVVRLAWYGKDLHRYLRLLEECVVRFLAEYGIVGVRRPGLTGVWVDGGKVAAVGVAVNRWIAWHGFALNIDPDLSRFTSLMHPCGISAEQGTVASVSGLLGRPVAMEEALPILRRAVAAVLQLDFDEWSIQESP